MCVQTDHQWHLATLDQVKQCDVSLTDLNGLTLTKWQFEIGGDFPSRVDDLPVIPNNSDKFNLLIKKSSQTSKKHKHLSLGGPHAATFK